MTHSHRETSARTLPEPEPPTPDRTHPGRCLNCGKEPLYTRYCPDCGQENENRAVSLRTLLADLAEELLRWDNRMFRTLGTLLFRPGQLTREYNAGRRVRYFSPFKMYFVVSALFFFLLLQQSPVGKMPEYFEKGIADSLNAERNKARKEAASKSAATGGKTLTLETSARSKSGVSRTVSTEGDTFNEELGFDPSTVERGKIAETYLKWQKNPKNKKKHDTLLRVLLTQVFKMLDHPAAFFSAFLEMLPKVMFFLVPAYGALLALFFYETRKFYVEHLVCAINNHTFFFVLGTVSLFLAPHFPQTTGALILWYIVYELVSLRRVYEQHYALLLFKQLLLGTFYMILISIVLVAAFVITLVLMR